MYGFLAICLFICVGGQACVHWRAWHPIAVSQMLPDAVGFHNFNLRIFILRVSNPNKLIVFSF